MTRIVAGSSGRCGKKATSCEPFLPAGRTMPAPKTISPWLSTRPEIAFKRVDLPAPFGPITPSHSPASISRSIPSSTTRSPKRTRTPESSMLIGGATTHFGSRAISRVRLQCVRSSKCSGVFQYDEEERSAESRGNDAERNLRRGEQGTGEQIRENQKARSEQH